MIVDVDFRKWGDGQHWRYDAVLLGRDDHGTWLGTKRGTAYTGPRGDGIYDYDILMLVPDEGCWVAAFDFLRFDVYVDVTTRPRWTSETHMTAIDLDLDVVHLRDGRVEVLDRDEFDEHRVSLGYPNDVAEGARRTADELRAAVGENREPFATARAPWHERMRRLT